MSFSDMMSSGRGPGVIGMLMALVVLVGFGLLFMFAFDEGFQGGVSIESELASQVREIENLNGGIAKGKTNLGLAPARNAASKELRQVKVETKTLSERSVALKAEIEEGNAGVAAMNKDWDAYKDRYRELVRAKAKGQVLDKLETRDGTVFSNVNIREVTAVGIQIRHDEGQKRIPFEDLPAEMQDYYQFDPAQKEKAIAAEAAVFKEHDASVAVAADQADAQMALQREKAAAEEKEKLVEQIAEKQAQAEVLASEIKDLQQEVVQANSDAAAARAAGKMHLNKSGNINSKIRSKQNRMATLQAEIRQLKARL